MPVGRDLVEEWWTEVDVDRARALAGPDSVGMLLNRFAERFGHRRVVAFGRAAHALAEALRRCPRRTNRVLVQAFTCSVVADAISSAGFELVTVDLDPRDFGMDRDQVAAAMEAGVDVIVASHLFGVPVDIRGLAETCRSRGIVLIEDCAHCLGGRIGDMAAGSVGDAAIHSFNHDKPIPLGWGGLLAINDGMLAGIGISDPPVPSRRAEWRSFRRYRKALAARRRLLGRRESPMARCVRRLRHGRGGGLVTARHAGIGRLQAALCLQALERLDEMIEIRNTSARRYESMPSIDATWPVAGEVTPAWLRMRCRPVAGLDHRVVSTLSNRGFRVGNLNWPVTVGSAVHPIAEEVALRWIDLPVHQNADPDLISRILRDLDP